mgnify:FL=1
MNLKHEIVLLDLIRDCIRKNKLDIAMYLIEEKQHKSNTDFALTMKYLKINNADMAMKEVNKILKDNGLEHSGRLLLAPPVN